MWHADAEWHVNYGDEVKIETEEDDGLKTSNCSLIVQVISPGYSNVRACVFVGVVQLHNLLNCVNGIMYAQLAGQFYGYTAEMPVSVCLKLWVKFSRKTANVNVKNCGFITTCKAHRVFFYIYRIFCVHCVANLLLRPIIFSESTERLSTDTFMTRCIATLFLKLRDLLHYNDVTLIYLFCLAHNLYVTS